MFSRRSVEPSPFQWQEMGLAPWKRKRKNKGIKGIVQRDLTWVETRLKRSVLMNYIVAKLAFWILKEHHHERSPKPVSASKQQLNWTCWMSSQNPANDGLRTMILEIWLIPADDLTVQHLYRTIISRNRSARTAEFYQCTIHCCTVQSYYGIGTVPYCHQPAQAGFFISQILARSS